LNKIFFIFSLYFLLILFNFINKKKYYIELEKKISDFYNFDDTILYSSCFDANGGFFETILDENDAVISDSLVIYRSSHKRQSL